MRDYLKPLKEEQLVSINRNNIFSQTHQQTQQHFLTLSDISQTNDDFNDTKHQNIVNPSNDQNCSINLSMTLGKPQQQNQSQTLKLVNNQNKSQIFEDKKLNGTFYHNNKSQLIELPSSLPLNRSFDHSLQKYKSNNLETNSRFQENFSSVKKPKFFLDLTQVSIDNFKRWNGNKSIPINISQNFDIIGDKDKLYRKDDPLFLPDYKNYQLSMDQNQQNYAQIAKQNLLDQQLVMKLNEKSISMPLSLTSNTQNNSSPINLIKPMTSQNLNQYHRQSDKFDNSYLLQDQIMKTNNKTVNNNQTFDQQKPQQSDTKYNTVLKGFQTENQRYESRIKELQQRLRNGDKFSSSVNHTRDNSFSKDQTAVQKNLQSKQVDVQVIQKSKNQTLNLIKPGQLQEQVMKKQSQGTHQRNNSYQLGSNKEIYIQKLYILHINFMSLLTMIQSSRSKITQKSNQKNLTQ